MEYDQQILDSLGVRLREERLIILARLQRNGAILVEQLVGAERTDRTQIFNQNERQKEMDKQFLADINDALARIQDQTYGVCQCRQLIPLARLVVIPTAKSCVACQAAKERSR